MIKLLSGRHILLVSRCRGDNLMPLLILLMAPNPIQQVPTMWAAIVLMLAWNPYLWNQIAHSIHSAKIKKMKMGIAAFRKENISYWIFCKYFKLFKWTSEPSYWIFSPAFLLVFQCIRNKSLVHWHCSW